MKVTEDYLRAKLIDSGYNSNSGNIGVVSDNVLKFTIYNFLPGVDGQLDGHYTFYVNYKTFKYLIYQSSYYGSLTYTTESKNSEWVTGLIDREFKLVESIIASKLLGAYYHDKSTLISGSNGRGSLVTDYRNTIWCDLTTNIRSEKDMEALVKLDKGFKLKTVKEYKLGKIESKRNYGITYNFTTKKGKKEIKDSFTKAGVEYLIPIYITFSDGTNETIYLYRNLEPIHMKYYDILDSTKKSLLDYSCNTYYKKPSDIIKIIPELFKSL